MITPLEKVVILARGLGTRMSRKDDAKLNSRQAAAADNGYKAMIPIGRPFLDYVLSNLADAGFREVCLVIGPEHDVIRDYYTRKVSTERLAISFAVQEQPLGTADAVLACQDFANGQDFAVINSDVYYPLEALSALQQISGAGAAMFDPHSLSRNSNIAPERIAASALAYLCPEGYLQNIIEKPGLQAVLTPNNSACVSKNCWRFTDKIFDACRSIEPSPRGEYELPDAVQYAIQFLDQRFKVLVIHAPVLDMSFRSDIGPVAEKLAKIQVNL